MLKELKHGGELQLAERMEEFTDHSTVKVAYSSEYTYSRFILRKRSKLFQPLYVFGAATFKLRRCPIDAFGDHIVPLEGTKRTKMCNSLPLSHNMNVD